MTLKADWKKAKTKFETATKKKKPSEKFLGLFRKSSGLESALDKIDKALAKVLAAKTQEEFDKLKGAVNKASKEYSTVMDRYFDTMDKGAEAEDENYRTELQILKVELMSFESAGPGEMLEMSRKKGWHGG